MCSQAASWGPQWAGPALWLLGWQTGPPTLSDGQAAELSQGCGEHGATEQGQCVGGQGTDVGVRDQGHAGLQEVLGSGNGSRLLLWSGWEVEPWNCPALPTTHHPPADSPACLGERWTACSPSLWILLGLPSPAAPVFKSPSPFFYVGTNFSQSLSIADQPREALGKTGRAPAPHSTPLYRQAGF